MHVFDAIAYKRSHANFANKNHRLGIFRASLLNKLTINATFDNISIMERGEQRARESLSRMTQPELEKVKRNWKNNFRIAGLVTLGAAVYLTTEALSGELKMTQISDVIVELAGIGSASATIQASEMLSLVKKHIVPPISTR